MDSWEQLPDFPGGSRSYSYGLTYDEMGYVGFGVGTEGYFNDLWKFELEDEMAVRNLAPDFAVLAATSEEGFIVTAAGSNEYDLVSRYFGPNLGINEDPVTGFAHCALVDYWYKKTGKTSFKAYQASKRGGVLYLEKKGDRVLIQGKAVVVLRGNLSI